MIFFKPSNSVKFVKLTAGQKRAIPLILAGVSIDEGCRRNRENRLKKNLFLTHQPPMCYRFEAFCTLNVTLPEGHKRSEGRQVGTQWGQPLTKDSPK
jgi:hypothetical protein